MFKLALTGIKSATDVCQVAINCKPNEGNNSLLIN